MRREELRVSSKKYKFKKIGGITLISLVITIVILIILSGILIGFIIGENGILTKVKYAKEEWQNAEEKEKDELDQLYSEMLVATGDNSQITIKVEDLRNIIKEEIEKNKNAINPVGSILTQMGNSAPEGYLPCNGATYNIKEYEGLAEYIKNQFGKYDYFGGDGSTTFAVPDLRGEFLRGTGTASRNTGSGASVGIHQAPTYIPNVYYYTDGTNLLVVGASDANATNQVKNWDTMKTNMGIFRDISNGNQTSRDNTVGGTIRPTNTSVLYCIKY